MALITDPDFLSQGKSTSFTVTFSAVSGANITMAATSIQDAIAPGDYFEVRDADTAENNGLYYCSTTGTDTADVIKIAGDGGANPANDTGDVLNILHDNGEAVQGDEKSVYIDFYNREIWLLKQGQLSDDGATLQAIYSFIKEEWKDDTALIAHPFPFVAITPEQFEMDDSWTFHEGTDAASVGAGDTVQDIETRKLVRTGGWREIGTDGILDKEYVGIITLGTFEDSANDLAYFQQGNDPTSTTATEDFQFAGPVNEAILSYNYMPSALGTVTISSNVITRSTGSWITDGYKIGGQITIVDSDTPADEGTYEITALTATDLTVTGVTLTDEAVGNTLFAAAVNNRNVLNVFLRVRDADPNGKTYAKATLTDIGVTSGVDNKVFRFPVSNATDLKISETDANISTTTPYTQVRVRYFDGIYSKDVDLDATPRNFGIVIDVGTHSGIDGAAAGGATFTTAEAGITTSKGAGTYVGGTLTIHGGTNKGTYGVLTEADGQVTVDASLSADTGMDFTLQRVTPIAASTIEIYEAVQYQLRQNSDINLYGTASQNVIGKTADELLSFVGDSLFAGTNVATTPSNPNDGGNNYTGVVIEGFSADDTNDIFFYDNAGTVRQFPFVAAGRINFNSNLVEDTDAYYWMFYKYTVRTTPTNAVTGTVSGRDVTFTVSTGAQDFNTYAIGDYLNITGFPASSNLNGIYRVTTFTSATSFVGYKISIADGTPTTDSTSAGACNLDEHPIDSPDAIIVEDNSAAPIQGLVSGASFRLFDYDYNNEDQGSRVAPGVGGTNDMIVVVRAIGFNSAQYVETEGTISRSTSIVISLVAALERNYSNAA